MELGGLGISSLIELGWALRMRWLWLAKTDPTRSWSALPMQIPHKAQALFSVSMQTEIGNRATTLFWQDRWLLAVVPKQRINKCIVQGLCGNKWISVIRGVLTVGVIVE
jgi:hypothetical protein